MSKTKWGTGFVTFLGLLLSVAILPDWLKAYLAAIFAIGMVVFGIGFFFAKDKEMSGSNVVVAPKQSGNIATAGRDAHQHIYQPVPDDSEKLADFIYDGRSSKIKFGFGMETESNKPRGEVTLELRFVNKGNGIAHNIGADVYGCWIHDEPPKAGRIDHIEPTFGRVIPGEGRRFILGFARYTGTTGEKGGQLTLHFHKDILVMLVEIIFSKSPTSSEICRNEPIWLTWTPQINTALCDSKQSEVQIARLAIDKIRPLS